MAVRHIPIDPVFSRSVVLFLIVSFGGGLFFLVGALEVEGISPGWPEDADFGNISTISLAPFSLFPIAFWAES